jgi:anti-anti-sigma factor
MKVRKYLGPVSVLYVTGDIDSATFFDLVKKGDEVLKGGHCNLVLDLGSVNFVSSGGLTALQTISRRAEAAGGKMVLSRVGQHVSDVFRMTGFDKVFVSYPSVEAAKAAFAVQ